MGGRRWEEGRGKWKVRGGRREMGSRGEGGDERREVGGGRKEEEGGRWNLADRGMSLGNILGATSPLEPRPLSLLLCFLSVSK